MMADNNDNLEVLDTPKEAPKVEPLKSYLEDRLVNVEPYENTAYSDELVKNKGQVKIDLFHRTKQSFDLPKGRGGHLIKILDNDPRKRRKTPEFPNEALTEQEFFEKMLGRDLDFLRKEDNFWETDPLAKVYISRNGIKLDLANEIDNLHYKILIACKGDFAPSKQYGYDNGGYYTFYMTDEAQKKKADIEKIKAEGTAAKIFASKIEDAKMISDFLKVAGHTNKNATKEWLQKAFVDIYQNSAADGYAKFIGIAEDKWFKEKILIADGVISGVLERMGKEYWMAGKRIGAVQDVIAFLNDPKNSPVVIRIQEMSNRT